MRRSRPMQSRRPITVTKPAATERRAATKAKVMAAARSLLASGESMAATTVGAVVAEAGISRATFYLHFDGKRGLIDALIAEAFESWSQLSGPMLSSDPDRAVLGAVVDAIVATWAANTSVLSALIETAEYDPATKAAWVAKINDVAETVDRWLATPRSDLTDAQRRAVAQVIAWGAERSLHRMLTAEPSSHRTVSAALTEVVWAVAAGTPNGPKAAAG